MLKTMNQKIMQKNSVYQQFLIMNFVSFVALKEKQPTMKPLSDLKN
jgi:hypothetical protein